MHFCFDYNNRAQRLKYYEMKKRWAATTAAITRNENVQRNKLCREKNKMNERVAHIAHEKKSSNECCIYIFIYRSCKLRSRRQVEKYKRVHDIWCQWAHTICRLICKGGDE